MSISLLATLLSANLYAMSQEADTLSASKVLSALARPVIAPVEEVYLPAMAAAPFQTADVIRRFTGVQVKDYGGVGGLKTVNVRSLGSEHVGIFLDGIQIDNAQNMQVDLSRFPTDGIGGVALYNSQKTKNLQTAKEYAAGAAIHFSSDVPAWNRSQVRIRSGSFGMFNSSLSWDHVSNGVKIRAGAEFLTSNGRYKYPCFGETLTRENGDIRSLRLETRLFGQFKGGLWGLWRLHAYTYGSERGFPGPVIRRAMGYPFSAERQADQDLFLQGSWTNSWTPHYATAARFKISNNYTHYNTHAEKNPMAMPYDLHYKHRAGYFSLAQSYAPVEVWSLDLSTDIQHNALDSDAGQFVTPRRTTFTGAMATRLALEKFRVSTNVVWQGAWDKFLTPKAGGWSREDGFRSAWMPSFSVYYSPWRWLELDAFAKRTCRLPSFNDLYYTLIGNSALEPESAAQFGLDLRMSGRRGHWDFHGRISPYFNRVDNKIVAIPTASQFRWSMLNIGLVDITGLDVKAGADYRKGDWTLQSDLRYSFQRALDHSDPESLTWGNQIPYIPLHSGSVDLNASWREWYFSWSTSLCSGRWSRTANISDYYIEPFCLSDASLARKIVFAPEKAKGWLPELKLGVHFDNVFNRPYQIVQGYPMPGFSAMAFAEFKW